MSDETDDAAALGASAAPGADDSPGAPGPSNDSETAETAETVEVAEPAEPTQGGRGLGVAVLVAVAAVVVVAAGSWWLSGRGDDGLSGPEAADALVEAYTRSVDATYLVEGELTRTLTDGRSLGSAYLVVQRPPDRIQRSLGSTSGELGGRTVNCSTAPDGEYSCAASTETASWEERRSSILGALESYVRGPDAVYSVAVDDQGCFVLRRLRDDVEATFGAAARLCFDERYGALRRLEVEREGGATDVMLADRITDQVAAADFDVEGDATYDPDVPDDAGTVPPPPSQEPPP